MIYQIYVLTDPLTKEVRYVGQTIKALRTRLGAHISEKSNRRKNTWIKSLHPLKPEIHLIDECNSLECCNESEIFWIAYLKFIGCNLTNHTNGGDGMNGYKQTEEAKKKRALSRIGTKLSDETKQKISDSKKNLSVQAKQNLSKASKKRGMSYKVVQAATEQRLNRSPEEKIKYAEIIRNSNKTRAISNETREKYKLRFKGNKRSEETKRKISETLKKNYENRKVLSERSGSSGL